MNKLKTISKDWRKIQFIDCISLDSLKKLNGLKKGEYRNKGNYPILDQGQKYISGYTNDEELLNKKYPAILFGDHTRIVKYIDFPFVVGADGTKVFQARKENDSKFLYYSLLNLDIPNTGYNRHFKFVKEAEILLPPLSEQKEIAKILLTVDKDIEKTDQIIKKTEKLKKGLMQKLFREMGSNDKRLKVENRDWRRVRLGEICEINPKTFIEMSDNEKVGFISMADVTNNGLIKNIKERSYKEVKKGYTKFKKGDVLFAKITPCMENGKGGFCVDDKYKFYFGSTEFHIIRCTDKILPEFIYQLINSSIFRLIAKRQMKGSAGQQRVPKEFLQKFSFLLPGFKEQQKNIEIFSNIDNKIEINKQVKNKLTQLKKGLMQDLLSGRVRVSL